MSAMRVLWPRLALHQWQLYTYNNNAVLDNCLSTLKHETMYYPSRIRQIVDQGDLQSLPEVTAYYRELYGLLSEQAQNQVEHAKLHLHRLDLAKLVSCPLPLATRPIYVLGDETLLRYLFELLRKHGGQRQWR